MPLRYMTNEDPLSAQVLRNRRQDHIFHFKLQFVLKRIRYHMKRLNDEIVADAWFWHLVDKDHCNP